MTSAERKLAEATDRIRSIRKSTLPMLREALRKFRPILKRHGFTYYEQLIPEWQATFQDSLTGHGRIGAFCRDLGDRKLAIFFDFSISEGESCFSLDYLIPVMAPANLWWDTFGDDEPLAPLNIGPDAHTEIGKFRLTETCTAEEIHAYLNRSYQGYGKPFFDKHCDLPTIEAALNTSPKVNVEIAHGWPKRAFWGLSLALMCRNPRYQELKWIYLRYAPMDEKFHRFLKEMEAMYLVEPDPEGTRG